MKESSLSGFTLFVCTLAGFCSLYSTQALGVEMQQRLALGVGQSTSLVTATTLALALASPLAGLAVQRLGTRRCTLVGLWVLALLCIGMALARSYPVLLALRFGQGVAIPWVLSALLASVGAGAGSLRMAALYVSATLCGGVLGRVLPAVLIGPLGWEGAFIGLALVHGLAALHGARHLPARAAAPPWPLPADQGVTKAQGLPGAQAAAPLLPVVLAGGFALLFSQSAVFTFVPFVLAQPPYGWSTQSLGWLYLVFLPALPFIQGARQWVARLGRGRCMALALVLAWLGLWLTLRPQQALVVAGLALFAMAVFFTQTVLAHALGQTRSLAPATASGRYLLCYYLGGSLGALAPAGIWQRYGWPGCLALVGALQLLVLAGAWQAHRRRRPPAHPLSRSAGRQKRADKSQKAQKG